MHPVSKTIVSNGCFANQCILTRAEPLKYITYSNKEHAGQST